MSKATAKVGGENISGVERQEDSESPTSVVATRGSVSSKGSPKKKTTETAGVYPFALGRYVENKMSFEDFTTGKRSKG